MHMLRLWAQQLGNCKGIALFGLASAVLSWAS
jgi:hypothetical protein